MMVPLGETQTSTLERLLRLVPVERPEVLLDLVLLLQMESPGVMVEQVIPVQQEIAGVAEAEVGGLVGRPEPGTTAPTEPFPQEVQEDPEILELEGQVEQPVAVLVVMDLNWGAGVPDPEVELGAVMGVL